MSKQLDVGAPLGRLYDFARQTHNEIASNIDYDVSNTRLRYGTLPNPLTPVSRTAVAQSTTLHVLERYDGPFAVSVEILTEQAQCKIMVDAGLDAKIFAGLNEVPILPGTTGEHIISYPSYDDIYVAARVACYDASTMHIIDHGQLPKNFKVYWDLVFGYFVPEPTRYAFIKPLGRVRFDNNGYLDKIVQWWHSGWIYVDGRIV